MRFGVPTVVKRITVIFCIMMLYNLVDGYQSFRGTCHFYLQCMSCSLVGSYQCFRGTCCLHLQGTLEAVSPPLQDIGTYKTKLHNTDDHSLRSIVN
jgi:hypothetical protein